MDLARGRGEQVGAAHDVGDVLEGVVHDYCELVGEQAVGALHDEVADFAFQMLADVALQCVVEFNNSLPLAGGG